MKNLNLENYNYQIPKDLIAQNPSPNREDSRLFIINKKKRTFAHKHFSDIVKVLPKNCSLVINNAKVIPSRIFGKKETGGKVEILFLSPHKENGLICSVLMKPFVLPNKKILFDCGYECQTISKEENGAFKVKFNKSGILGFLQKRGIMPLPSYINRKEGLADTLKDFDKNRYQTIYAKELGAIAAPTAGLHFTQNILEELENKGIEIVRLTLYVGWGTFKPITNPDISKHIMPSETFCIDKENAEKLNRVLAEKRRIISVGTTASRALESLAQKNGKIINKTLQIEPFEGQTDIFIYPSYKFKIVKGLITNFHQPKSTPLMMASAFCSRSVILKAYREAIKKKYRFFSYGDAMLII